MKPDTAKTLGGVGSILAVLGLDIVGYILVLIGLRGLGGYYNDEDVKRNSLKWFIFGLVGSIATIVVFIVASQLIFGALEDSMESVVEPSIVLAGVIAGVIATVIITLIVAEIFYVISAMYLKKVYAALAAKSGEDLFDIAAKLYWWGSVLTVLVVGTFLIWISWIISAIAFFVMKPQRPDVATQTAPPPPG